MGNQNSNVARIKVSGDALNILNGLSQDTGVSRTMIVNYLLLGTTQSDLADAIHKTIEGHKEVHKEVKHEI